MKTNKVDLSTGRWKCFDLSVCPVYLFIMVIMKYAQSLEKNTFVSGGFEAFRAVAYIFKICSMI